uniref:RRM domain-containing protein n=1 Tax=Lactuca sativa TaxID=4236 RepID=A0A9R1XGE5_LACSA|nr:hypothetical protein LSAT_V11C400185650 [Lactuca sativa]
MLNDTATYYSRKASNWILEDSCPDYMFKAGECLKREKDRVSHYLHSSSEPKLLETWWWWWWWLSWWCPSQPNPNLNLAAAGLTPGGIGGAEGLDRIFVGGLPYYFTEVQIRELLESFGPLRGFDLVKDRDTGNSKGYGLCVYEDQAATDVACAALNGLKIGDKTLTVRRATINGQMKSEQETIMAQAQQHIAMQKMALQVGGFNLPGLPRLSDEILTKVLCLTEGFFEGSESNSCPDCVCVLMKSGRLNLNGQICLSIKTFLCLSWNLKSRLDNDELSHEQVNDVKDFIGDYVERNQVS